ncbi:hypothetical protein Trydic_g8368 [Trypoxylus dichotomus]
MRPVVHDAGITIPKPPADNSEFDTHTVSSSDSPPLRCDIEYVLETSNASQALSQIMLDDLIRDSYLLKDTAELL